MHLLKRSNPETDVAEANLEPQMRSDASLDLEASLPQPAEDNSIMADFTSLRTYIESHTLEFYHSEPVQIYVAELKIKLEEILPRSVPVASLETLARALLQPESRPAGIRAVIAHMLFASIDFCGDSGRTILPPFAITHMSTFHNSQDWTAEMQQVHRHALSKWRVLSTFLLSAPDGRPRSIAPSSNSRRLTETLNNVFTPFAIRSLKEKRVENLSQIVARTAKIGNILFGQPSTWRFRWNLTPSNHTRQETILEEKDTKVMIKPSVVVYPAIEKIGDVDGVELVEPIVKEEAEVFFLTTFSNLSSDTGVSRKGSLDNNDLVHSKSTVPRPVAHDRAPPEHPSFPERLPSRTVLEEVPTSGQLPFEGPQPSLGSQTAYPETTEPQTRIDVSNSDVVGSLPPHGEKIKGPRRIKGWGQSLRTVGTKIGGLSGTGTKKGAIGAAPFPAQNPPTPGAEKSLPDLPDSQEQQEIRITSEQVDKQPGIDTELNGSRDISQPANQYKEQEKRVSV